MALRVCNKITSSIIQNFCRQLSAKADLASSAATTKDVTGKDEATTPKSQVYSLGQMQSLNLNKKYNTQQMCSEIELAKKNIENQSLQPSMLPNYYENTMDLGMSVNNEGNTDQKRSSDMYRTFKKSETYSKVTLPLRPSKLASPFPDPVKVMQSHTVSDEEKAAQMLADSRASRYSQKQEQHKFNFVPNRSFSTTSATFRRRKGSSDTVSTDPKKCKRVRRDDKKVCRKMKLPGCEAPKRTTCKRLPMVVKCKKQEAPYPSYSESCHEDIEEKPSECKMCPWKPDQHPYFKPKNKEFHTASSHHAQQRRQKGTENNTNEAAPAAGEELLVDNAESSKIQEVSTAEGSGLDIESPGDTTQTEPFSYKCDLRKKPCKRPKRRSCADRGRKGKKGKKGKRRRRRKGKKGRRGKGKKGKRGKRKGRKGRKGKKRKGKKNRRGRRRGKKRTLGWTDATRAWAQRGGDTMPELRLDMIEHDLQQTAMEMSSNRQRRDQSRSSEKTNKNKNKKHSLGWTEAARVWAERTEGLAAEVRAASPLQQVQDFHEAPPHLDLNNEAGTGMLCKRRRGRGRGRGRRKKGGRRKKKKGKKGKRDPCKKKKKKPKCKKFPLGDCRAPKRKGRRKAGRCPPKKKKRKIKDCPPDDDRGCKRTSSVVNDNWGENREYNLPSREMMQEPYMKLFEDEGKGKRRCPKPDLTIAKDYEIKKCPKKRNPSRICPGNLLRKKRRNKYRGRKGRNRKRRDTSSRHVSVPLSLQPDASATEESVRI